MASVIPRERFTDVPKRRFVANRIFSALCFLATLIGIILLVILLVEIFKNGLKFLDFEFFNKMANSRPKKAGIQAALKGSLWVMMLTAVIAVPIGIAAAIFLQEFTRRKTRLTSFIEINIANLAGVPSIVYGLLGLTVFVRFLALDTSIIAAALTMTLLILPMLISVTQEALKAVPQSYREASYGMGATTWQTIRLQVLPNAAGGIFTGIILAVSRAIGETAPLLVIGATAFINFTPSSPADRYTVLPIQIYNWIGLPQNEFKQVAASAIIVLLALLLFLNSLAIFLRYRAQRRLH